MGKKQRARDFYNTGYWKTWRKRILKRDGYRCTARVSLLFRCPETEDLHVHHKKPRSKGGKESYRNLETLCAHHHRMQHPGNKYL